MVDISYEAIATLVSVIAVAIAFLSFWMNRSKLQKDDLDKIKDDLSIFKLEVTRDIACLKTKWEFIEREMAVLVKQPIHEQKDKLIDKYIGKNASPEDLVALKSILKTELSDYLTTKDSKAIAVALLLAGIEERLNKYPQCSA